MLTTKQRYYSLLKKKKKQKKQKKKKNVCQSGCQSGSGSVSSGSSGSSGRKNKSSYVSVMSMMNILVASLLFITTTIPLLAEAKPVEIVEVGEIDTITIEKVSATASASASASAFTTVVPEVCTYDYTIIQRVGKTTYDGLPIKILRQSGDGTVDFTVGNTWSSSSSSSSSTSNSENQIENQIETVSMYVITNDVAADDKYCFKSNNVQRRKSINSSLQAQCSRAGIAIVKLYASSSDVVSDSNNSDNNNGGIFNTTLGDTARILQDCYDDGDEQEGGDDGTATAAAVEYIAVLQCEPTCIENTIPDLDPFIIDFDNGNGGGGGGGNGEGGEIVKLTCPSVNDDPIVIQNWNNNDIAEFNDVAAQNELCTIVEMNVVINVDGTTKNKFSNLKPVGRSYNGNEWEVAPGEFSKYDFDCDGNGSCRITLPKPSSSEEDGSNSRYYVLKSYNYGQYTLTEDDIKARFLERNTFGPTKLDIATFTSTQEEWLSNQISPEITPISSHRSFFRERVTSWYYYTGKYGLLNAGPCKEEAKYRKFVLLSTDYESDLEIQISPLNSEKLILSIGGQVRTVINGPLQYDGGGDVTLNENEIYRYEIKGKRPVEGVGGKFFLRGFGIPTFEPISFGGVFGNPIVEFDDEHAAELLSVDNNNNNIVVHVVDINEQSYTDVLTQYFFSEGVTEMIQLTSDISGDTCDILNSELQGFTGPPKSRIGRTITGTGTSQYWIYSQTYNLLDNTVNNPLQDGGQTAVNLTRDPQPEFILDNGKSPLSTECSNVPRSFLNEDYGCQLSDVVDTDTVCSYDRYADIDITVGGKVLVCGSPYETANNNDVNSGPRQMGGFDLNGYNRTASANALREQRKNVWAYIALWGKDQLRQKMAYSLSQILVISPDTGCADCTENYLSYYDIFVKHAFGNYFDILKEVTLHPMMSYMLTYINGASTGYSHIRNNLIVQADENYAREIMQLFSIGLVLLNDDGTLQLDEDGNEIATYTNFDISEYAKVYVGFELGKERGNIETNPNNNQVDPLRINAEANDFFPKLGLDKKFIGDGYPLCSDLPPQYFLKKGATYRILGAKANPDYVIDPNTWWGTAGPKRVSLDTDSVLAAALSGGKNKVVLQNDIECTGIECDMLEPRTIEVVPGLWYEYIRPPCVNQAFYNNGKSIYSLSNTERYKSLQCGNPKLLDASTVCRIISDNRNFGRRKELFSSERVLYDEAVLRCTEPDILQMPVTLPRRGAFCDDATQGGCDRINLFYWLNAPCSISVKVNSQGSIAIVHEPNVAGKTPEDTFRYVANNTKSFFRTDWLSSNIESFLSNFDEECGAHGCSIDDTDGKCQCDVDVENIVAFEDDSEFVSVDNLLSVATIGAFVTAGTTSFVSTGVDGIKKSSEELNSDTIFEVVDNIGRTQYRKNVKSIAKLGDGTLMMRNPVSFHSLSGYTNRDAEYELHATLEQYFYHQNVASFLAQRVAQHFGTSNPSKRYIKVIATAFKTGNYMGFGSNEYGCLEATIAAVVLDRESKDHILDSDPVAGKLQGPFLRFIKTMRALEYETDVDNPFPRFFTNIEDSIGEEPHAMQTVFNFFQPEYIAPGRSRAAGMLAPEAQILNGPTSISTSNGLISLIKYGAAQCYSSIFGGKRNIGTKSISVCKIGDNSANFGNNKYSPSKYGLNATSADDVVADLSTLLTSGRLSHDNRLIVKNAFMQTLEEGKSELEALVNAQQLIVLAPEFHSMSLARKTNKPRALPVVPEPTGVDYKAIVHLMLSGGMDSWNVLVPKSCTGTNAEGTPVHVQYLESRGALAFTSAEFGLTITPNTDQPCEIFAIHEDLPIIKELYDDGDLLFFANTGVVNENGMDKSNWDKKTKTRLFAHNSMQQETKKVDPYDDLAGSGWLGRLKDLVGTKFNSVVNAIGIQGNSIMLAGDPAIAIPTSIVGRNGPSLFGYRPKAERDFTLEDYSAEINSEQDAFSSIFTESWSDVFSTGVDESKRLLEYFDDGTVVNLDADIWKTTDDEDKVYQSFQTLAKMVQTRSKRNVDRDVFTIEYGGFDHHDSMKDELKEKLIVVNKNIQRLVEQLKKDGIWDKVTIIVASEFGRTLTQNSNNGADHGWAGNYFVMGGKIDGGRILGKYPDDLTEDSRLNASRNDRVRFIPTTSWDAILNGITMEFVDGFDNVEAELTEDDLDYVLPNRANGINPVKGEGNFPLYTKEDLYL